MGFLCLESITTNTLSEREIVFAVSLFLCYDELRYKEVIMDDEYKTLHSLLEFLVFNDGQSGVCIEYDVVNAIATELKQLLAQSATEVDND